MLDDDAVIFLIGGCHEAGHRAAELPMQQAVEALERDVEQRLADERLAALDAADRAILRFLPRLVIAPRKMTAAHLTVLAEAALGDAEIHDVVQVACCFSFMNRLADGLGVELTEARAAWAERLLGSKALAEHRAWAEPFVSKRPIA